MRSEKGVTITSIIIYVIALTITVLIIGRITTYFYKNLNSIDSDTRFQAEYMKFNSFFTEEVNIEGNNVREFNIADNIDEGPNYIIFEKTGNQYTWKNGKIYKGKATICKNIDRCSFAYNQNSRIITVNMKIDDKMYNNTYTIVE